MNYDTFISADDARLALRTSVSIETKAEHRFVFLSRTEKSCTVNGSECFLCEVCELKATVIFPADGHKWTKITLTEKPRCTVCGAEDSNAKLSLNDYRDLFTSAVDNTKIKDSLYALSVTCGTRFYKNTEVTKAAELIKQTLKTYGFTDDMLIIDPFKYNDVSQNNIYAIIPTTVKNPEIAVICAHYDSASVGKGATDNASGVASVLETARILKSLNADFGREIRFCFFSCEEQGYHGAYNYRKYASLTDGENYVARHKFILNADMTAHPIDKSEWFLCVSTEPGSDDTNIPKAAANYTSKTIDAAKKSIGSCGEKEYLSPVAAGKHDLKAFRRYSLNGVTLSWREKKEKNKNDEMGLCSPALIHTSRDTFDNTDLNSLYATTKLIIASVAVMLYDCYK